MVVHRPVFLSALKAALVLVLIAWQPAGWTQAQATPELAISVDKNPIAANDTFILTLTINQLVNDSAWRPQDVLDDLQILGSSSSRSTQIINGETTEQTTFNTIIRAPDTAGDYSIGPIELLGATSNSITLEVLTPADSEQLLDQRKAFMRVELNRSQVYVQEQVQLTAKLYLAANLHSGNIIPPKLEEADIRQVGRDSEATEIINGRKFQVFSRDFVLIPQRSGEQVIRGPLFQGQINVNSNRTLFPSFSSTEAITTAAENLTLNVLPIPTDWPGQSEWLPAEIVTLSVSVGSEGGDQEQSSAEQYSQGEPINLTYRLTAVGPLPDQLPRLDELISALTIVGASVYPEAPESAVNQRNGRMVSQQTVRVAVIPHQAGELVIPELPVVWFNTELRERNTATAPAQRFSIIASANTSGQATLPDAPATVPAEPDASSSSGKATSAAQQDSISEQQDSASSQIQIWQILTVVFATLWLMTFIWAIWRRQQAAAQPAQVLPDNNAPQQELRAIKHACMRDDAGAVELLLKRWSKHHLGIASSQLTSIADYFGHAPLRSQLEHLQRCRFASGDYSWHEGKALWRALQSALKSAEHKTKATQQGSDLPLLYPNND